MASSRICTIPGCGKVHEGRGYCSKHYQRWQTHGDPLFSKMTERGEPLAFLMEAVSSVEQNCITWPYALSKEGYGSIRYKGTTQLAHRMVCELAHGSPPTPQHEAAHSCGRGSGGCINPNHLRWATRGENANDRISQRSEPRGDKHPNAKLSTADVLEIRRLVAEKSSTHAAIGNRFGVSKKYVGRVANRHRWAHV